MYILRSQSAPNGAATTIHRVQRVEATPVGTVVVINSYVSEAEDAPISWQDSYSVPEDAMTGPVIPSVLTWLVSPAGPFDGGQLLADPGPFDLAVAKVHDRIRALRDAIDVGGCETPFGRIDTSDKSKIKLTGSVVMASALGAAYSDEWRMADDTLLPIDAAKIVALGTAVGQFVSACQGRKNALDEAVAAVAADDFDALAAININTGWPT